MLVTSNWRFRRNLILYKCYDKVIVVLLLIQFVSAIPIRGAFDLARPFSSTERTEWLTSSIKQGRQLQTMNPLSVVDELSPMTSKSFSADDGSTEVEEELSTQDETHEKLHSHHNSDNTLAGYLSLAPKSQSPTKSSELHNSLHDNDYPWTDYSTLKDDKELLQSTQINSFGPDPNVSDTNQRQLGSSSDSTELLLPIFKSENFSEYEADNLSYKSALKVYSTSQIDSYGENQNVNDIRQNKLEARHHTSNTLNQTSKSDSTISVPFPVDLTSDRKEIYMPNLNNRQRMPDLSTDNIRVPNEKWPFSRSFWSYLDKNDNSSHIDRRQEFQLASFNRKPQSKHESTFQNEIKSISREDTSGEKNPDTKKNRHLQSSHSIDHGDVFTGIPQTTDTYQKVNLVENSENDKGGIFTSLNINNDSDKMRKNFNDQKGVYVSIDRVNYLVRKEPKNGNYLRTSLERKREETSANFKTAGNILGKTFSNFSTAFQSETATGRKYSLENLIHHQNEEILNKNTLQHQFEDEQTLITENTPYDFTTSYPTSLSSLEVLNKIQWSPVEKETANFISDTLEEKSANFELPLDLQKDSEKLKEGYLGSGERETTADPSFHSNRGNVTTSLKTQPFLEDILFKNQSLHEPSRQNEKRMNKSIFPENQSFYFRHKEFPIPDDWEIKSAGTTIKKAFDIGHIPDVLSDIYDVRKKGEKPTMFKNKSRLSIQNINVDIFGINGSVQVSKKDELTPDKANEKSPVDIKSESSKDALSTLSERILSLISRSYPNYTDHDTIEVYLRFEVQNTSKSDSNDETFFFKKKQDLKDISKSVDFTSIQQDLRVSNITELADLFAFFLVVDPHKRNKKTYKNTLPKLINHKEQFGPQKVLPSDSFASRKITLPSITTSEPMKSSLYDQQLSGSTETAWLDSEQAYDEISVLDTFGEVPISSKKMEKENFHSKRAISRNWNILLNKSENVQGSGFVSIANWLQEKSLFSQILENRDDIQQTEGKSSMVDINPLMKGKIQSLRDSESRDIKSLKTENKNEQTVDKHNSDRKKYTVLDFRLLPIDLGIKEKNNLEHYRRNVSAPSIFSQNKNSEDVEDKKDGIEIADIYKSTTSLHGFDLNSAQVSNPLKSESSNSLTKEISSLEARISPGNQEVLLADQIVFPLEPDRKFSFELKVNNASWVEAFNFSSISKDTIQQKTNAFQEDGEEIRNENFSTSTLKVNAPDYHFSRLENNFKESFNSNRSNLKMNFYRNLLKPENNKDFHKLNKNKISERIPFNITYSSSKKDYVARDTLPTQHHENKPVSINSIFVFYTLFPPTIQESVKAEEDSFSSHASFLQQRTRRGQETISNKPPVYTWPRIDKSILETSIPPNKSETEGPDFNVNALQPISKSHTKRDIMINTVDNLDDADDITHRCWPWIVLILSGNLKIAAMRELDFPLYLRLNLAARFDGSLNDYFVNNVTFYPILAANISVRTELYAKTKRTLCKASNIPLIRLNGYDFSVMNVIDNVTISNRVNVLESESIVNNSSIWRQKPVLLSAIGTVACFCAVAVILGAILHCHGTHEAEPFLIINSVRTKPPPPPPVIYSRRLAEEMNFGYFRRVLKQNHTKKRDKFSSLSAKLILNDLTYKNSFFE
ncbi:uncharacterized protein LOC136038665 [Artemia franciscana]|uniref:uncharacterized protein LOC136038665 n=1 Tax=Artemia franciscana TaxID=6661 RepID=UPI0032D9C17E